MKLFVSFGYLLVFLGFILVCQSISVCTDCNSKNPLWIVKDDRTLKLWGEKHIYKIDPENVRLHLQIQPKAGQGWNRIRVEEIDPVRKLQVFTIGEGSHPYRPHGDNPEKVSMSILFKCEKEGISEIKVTIPIQDNENENPSGEVVFFFSKDCGKGGPREGFNIASTNLGVGVENSTGSSVIAYNSVVSESWKSGSTIITPDTPHLDLYFWMSNKRGSVLYKVDSSSDKNFVEVMAGHGKKNYLDPKVGSEKLTLTFTCIRSYLPLEGTTSEIPTADVTVFVEVMGWDTIAIKFKKQCPLAKDPGHYINVYEDSGKEVILKGSTTPTWKISDKKDLVVFEDTKTKEFTVNLDRDSNEFHFPVTAYSSNPFVVDIEVDGELKNSGTLTNIARSVKIHHYCRDVGSSYISVSLPLTHSETLHWSYKVVCKKISHPVVVHILTANQAMFIICIALVVVSVLLFYYWDVVEKTLSQHFSYKKKTRQNKTPLQEIQVN